MRDQSILKVFHAARQDVEILYNLQAMPAPLFDTQVAGMAAGFPEQVAYDGLVRQMLLGSSSTSPAALRTGRAAPLSLSPNSPLPWPTSPHLASLYPMLRARLEDSGRLASG